MGKAASAVVGAMLVAGAVGFLGWRVMEMRAAPAVLPEDGSGGHLMGEQPGLTVRADKTVVDPFGKVYGYEGKGGHLVDAKGGRINRDGTAWVERAKPSATERARMWYRMALQPTQVLKGQKEGVLDLAFSADGKVLVSGGADGDVIVWDVRSGAEVRRVATGLGNVVEIALSGDGRRVAGVGLLKGWGVWDVATGEKVGKGDDEMTLGGAVFFPDGEHLAMGKLGGVAICDVRTGAVGVEAPTGEHVIAMGVSRDGTELAAGGENTVTVLDKDGVVTGVLARTWGKEGARMRSDNHSQARVRKVGFDEKGRVVFLDGNGVWRWDVGTGKVESWSAPAQMGMVVAGGWAWTTDTTDTLEVMDLDNSATTDVSVPGTAGSVAMSQTGMLAVGMGGRFEGSEYKGVAQADIVLFPGGSIGVAKEEWEVYRGAEESPGKKQDLSVKSEIETWQ